MGRRRLLAGIVIAVLTACSPFSSTTEPSAPASADASSADGGGASEGGSSDGGTSDAAGAFNGGFEAPAAGGCGPDWYVGKGSGELVPSARSGSQACRICNTDGTTNTFYVELKRNPQPGSWTAKAWVRIGANVPASGAYVGIDAELPDGGLVDGIGARFGNLDATWKEISQTVTVANGASSVALYVQGDGPPMSCLDIDDFTFVAP